MSQVGRRYNINANLILKWRRDPRYRPTEDGGGALSFLPAEPASAPPTASDGRIEIALSNGHWVGAPASAPARVSCSAATMSTGTCEGASGEGSTHRSALVDRRTAWREKLLVLASQWLDLMPPAPARAQRERSLDGLAETRFAWSGPLEAGSDVSWAIQGPSIVIEYANDAPGGADAGNPVDHVHTVYRDLDRDYGGRPRSSRQAE